MTKISTLYKISSSKFILVFESKRAIACFRDKEIILSFQKLILSSWKWKGAYFVTLFFPEYVSDQAVRLAFSSFGKSSFCLLKHLNLLEWWFASVRTEHYDKNLCLHSQNKTPVSTHGPCETPKPCIHNRVPCFIA